MALDSVAATGTLIVSPLVSLYNSFIQVFPGIIAAVIVLIIGYFVSMGVGKVVYHILEKAGLSRYMEQARLSRIVGGMRLSKILEEVTKWYIFIIFLQAAVDLLNLGTLSVLLNRFVLWLPNVIAAALIIIFGIALSHIIAIKIEEHTDMKGTRLLTRILKIIVIILVVLISLEQIGIKTAVIENTFLLLVGAVALGIAIALGIGLGGGLKKESQGIIQHLKDAVEH
ncbi:hypothetical protein CL617_01300 [archaeon]|nr:hypothetical protein [archaeon]|tara:strand:+ start:3727 stop:4407 length:681 start_codon:yes stop_codon:yes gene_type:complete